MNKKTRARKLREVILQSLAMCPEGAEVALSAGVDSTSVLIALTVMKKKPTAASFRIRGAHSSDFLTAQETARQLDVPFRAVELDERRLRADATALIGSFGIRKKTAVECVWPFMQLREGFDAPALVTGSCADGYFGISKKAMIHYRDEVEKLNDFRGELFADRSYAQTDTLAEMFYPIPTFVPYRDPALMNLFWDASWDELNRPKQKQTIRDAFPELGELPEVSKGRHTNLQLGDSGIAAAFEDELESPIKFYNATARAATRAPVLIIGQAPNQGGDPRKPLTGVAGDRLANLAGITRWRYLRRTERKNLLHYWPGKKGKGDAFPATEAKTAAAELAPLLVGRRVLFAGRAVANSFRQTSKEYCRWFWSPSLRCRHATIPHPSGIVRWWNEEKNREHAAAFLRDALSDEGEKR